MRRVLAMLSILVAALSPSAGPAATGILAAGDFGVGGPGQTALGWAMRRYEEPHAASVLVTLGDNDYTGSPTRFERNWAASFGWLPSAGVAVAGVLGNHDLEVGDGGRYQLPTLGRRKRYESRRIGVVQLFLLDSNTVDAAQTSWLTRALRRSTARWKIAAFHHPPFTCGGHTGDDSVRTSWVPLFERYGVRLVLSGHDHNYQRFALRRGVAYVVHGGGNPNLYELTKCPADHPRRLVGRKERGFLYLLAGEAALLVSAVDLSGKVVDRLTLYP